MQSGNASKTFGRASRFFSVKDRPYLVTTLKNSAINLLPFILFLFYFNSFHQTIYSHDADDAYFGSTARQYSTLGDYIQERYTHWSGRVSVETTMYFVRQNGVHLWRRLNPIVFTALCFILTCLVLGRRFWLRSYHETASTAWFICLAMGLINIQVTGSGIFWITGSFFYLWPLTTAAFALILFREHAFSEPIRPAWKLAALLALSALAAAYTGLGNEQIGLTLLGIMAVTSAGVYLRQRHLDPALIAILLVTAISMAISWSAPGNRIRYENEIALHFPGFRDLSLGQHLLFGLTWMLDKTINVSRILLIVLFGLMALNLHENKDNSPHGQFGAAAFFIAAFLLITSLSFDNLHPKMQEWVNGLLYTFREQDDFTRSFARLGKNYNYYLFFIPYLLWIPVLASIPYFLYRCFPTRRWQGAALAVLFIAALGSLAALFFSPTMIASGNRVVLVYSVITIFISGVLFFNVRHRLPRRILIALFTLAALNIVFQHIEWNGNYFIHW